MFRLRPKNNRSRFRRQLNDIRRSWQGRRISGLLSVSPEAYFWYWQEYGTGTKGMEGYASGEPYIIEAKNAKSLAYPVADGVVYPKAVLHPGIRPARFVARALVEIIPEANKILADAFMSEGITIEAAYNAMDASIMPMALQHVITELEQTVPGSRPAGPGYPAGKLGGQTAAEVFLEAATLSTTII